MKRRRSGFSEEEEKIDISPLIDCVFILLIFFIVTTTFVEEEGVEVNKPDSAASASDDDDENENVVLSIDAGGNIINENTDETIGASGVQPLIRNALNDNPDTPVILQPADDSQAGVLISVIDQALLAGVKSDKISITKEGTAQ
jgi:biopolymer transport protein ExbD